MSDDTVISVHDVSKAYRIWESPAARLASPLQEGLAGMLPAKSALAGSMRRRAARHYKDFHALRGVSFTVKRGESVGIIGRNGSGKSTLLQIIAGTLQPTAGSVRVTGRVAALLELGSGFNPEFTGRENVLLTGAILGFSREQMERRFAEIAAFADIGEFIEQPVKTYSSGMLMRLAFSVQISVDADVLIIDESLAVGDAHFVAKCINRISDFIRSGRTLLFVSHEVGVVKQLTSKALYLDHGRQMAFGSTPETALAYTSALAMPAVSPAVDPDRYAHEKAPYVIKGVTLSRPGQSGSIDSLATGDPAQLTVSLAAGPRGSARLVFSIYNYMGIIVCSSETDLPTVPPDRDSLEVKFDLPRVRLAPGNYRVNFAVRIGREIVGWARNALHFNVTGATIETFIYREDIAASFIFTAGP